MKRIGWQEVKLHNGLVLLRDTAKRVYEVRDLGTEDVLRKLPDPPPLVSKPARPRSKPRRRESR